MISIIDYGMGNLRSVQNAIEHVGGSVQIIDTQEEIDSAEKLILPGVGAFRDAIGLIEEKRLSDSIRAYVDSGKPFLGICLGLQLLFDVSYEDGEYKGLGIVPGEVVRFESALSGKVPHMGWNEIKPRHSSNGVNTMFGELGDPAYCYFVHSYYVKPTDESVVALTTDYGVEFVSAIQRDNLYATQFHPEKSHRTGLELLKRFVQL